MKYFIFISTIMILNNIVAAFELKSNSVENLKTINNEYVFNGFGCVGKNQSPHLKWSNAPKETKYFAITVFDPDAPTGSGWWHWILINIPSTTTEIGRGVSSKLLPIGSIETKTDFGKIGYGGPCPPVKDKPHRYIFKVFALKDKVPLESDASGAMVGYYLNSLKISEAEITGYYGR